MSIVRDERVERCAARAPITERESVPRATEAWPVAAEAHDAGADSQRRRRRAAATPVRRRSGTRRTGHLERFAQLVARRLWTVVAVDQPFLEQIERRATSSRLIPAALPRDLDLRLGCLPTGGVLTVASVPKYDLNVIEFVPRGAQPRFVGKRCGPGVLTPPTEASASARLHAVCPDRGDANIADADAEPAAPQYGVRLDQASADGAQFTATRSWREGTTPRELVPGALVIVVLPIGREALAVAGTVSSVEFTTGERLRYSIRFEAPLPVQCRRVLPSWSASAA